jgi:hypothetical protein
MCVYMGMFSAKKRKGGGWICAISKIMSFVYYMRITGMTNEQRGVVMKEICTRRHAGGRGGGTRGC